ncbi:PKD domain-containing protein [Aureispira anguillae]|uniref:PKD domain-containing protein n=1 Tax=Aureispira anguillae TaxID=2864201 RepID=A0A915Y9V2_9BACT|nr:PKD domain-containing protein [Aureispira anguillae]BDS09464.1 PKD domain-containing protein [Aureispira anguillae]
MQKVILLILLFSFFFNLNGHATHIVGGEINYECLGPSPSSGIMQYKITMHVYRDLINSAVPFDNPAIIGIYTGPNSTTLHSKLALGPPITARIPMNISNPCLVVPPNIGVEEAIYVDTVELPYNADGYWISYQRCCRNNTILNINTPGTVGGTYTIFLSALAQQQCNTSPTFNAFPPIVICLNNPLEFDHSATDPDGNTLVYEFCAPFTGGGNSQTNPGGFSSPIPNPPAPPPYTPVPFNFGFSASYPMPASPSLAIDPNTGFLTGFPTAQGQYSVGICVKEYDSQGNLLSTTLRDFQFNVTACDDQVSAKIPADSIDFVNDLYYVSSCSDSTIKFTNTSTIQSFINSYEWRFDLGNGNIFSSGMYEPTVTFPNNGTYQGWLIANPGSTGCTDTTYLSINISLDLSVDFSLTYDSCDLKPIDLLSQTTYSPNSPIISYAWDFGDGSTSNQQHPSHQYNYPDTGLYTINLTVEDASGCTVTHSKDINWSPQPIFPIQLVSDTICLPADSLSFQSIYYPRKGYTFAWNFGDGHSSNEVRGAHLYNTTGFYTRTLTVKSPRGCTENFSSTHTLLNAPKAAFSYNPTTPTSFEPLVHFMDESESANLWEWNFGNGDTRISSLGGNISYTYPDTGKHLVSLIVTHTNGCTDSAQHLLDIAPQFTYFLPNALTPNNDGKNDVYMGKGYTRYIKNFELNIYSRWGELLFRTNDPTEAWNGRKNNNGKKCQAGVYVVIARIKGPRGKQHEVKGFATIVY